MYKLQAEWMYREGAWEAKHIPLVLKMFQVSEKGGHVII